MESERQGDAWDVDPVMTGEEWVAAASRNNRPPTSDDVSITWDGRRLDTVEKVLAFLVEIEADRLAGVTFEELTRRQDEYRSRA